jgi:hypothetical protein
VFTEIIWSEKCYTTCPILRGFRAMVILNAVHVHSRHGCVYAVFLQNELLALLENLPLQTQLQMYYQHNEAPLHLRRNIMWYLKEQFPGGWICSGSMLNRPLYAPTLSPSDYHVWDNMKKEAYECKVNIRDELLQQISDSARHGNNTALHKVTHS